MIVQDGSVPTAEWPSLLRYEVEQWSLDGYPLDAIAARFGTPTWVLSRTMEDNYRTFVDTWSAAYPHIDCTFSMKANHLLALVQFLAGLGLGFDRTGRRRCRSPSRLVRCPVGSSSTATGNNRRRHPA